MEEMQVSYKCGNCKQPIGRDDQICPSCGRSLSEVHREVVVIVHNTIGIKSEMLDILSKEQRNFVKSMWDSCIKEAKKNKLTGFNISVGFPQFITITLKYSRDDKKQ